MFQIYSYTFNVQIYKNSKQFTIFQTLINENYKITN